MFWSLGPVDAGDRGSDPVSDRPFQCFKTTLFICRHLVFVSLLNSGSTTVTASNMETPRPEPVEPQTLPLNDHEKPDLPRSMSSQSDLPRNPEKDTVGTDDAAYATKDEEEYVTGVKLYMILAAMVLAQFVVMLDISIMATVRARHFSTLISMTSTDYRC